MSNVVAKTPLFFVLALAVASFAQTPTAPSQTAPVAPTPYSVKDDQQDSFTVVGLTVRTNNAAEMGGQGKIPELWQGAMNGGQLQQIPNQAGDGFVVVYSDYASDNTGDYNYTLGVRVSSADKVPAGFVVRKIQAGKYAVIQSETGPPEQVIPALWQHINALTPQQLGGTRAYQTDFETYPNITDWGSVQITAHIGLK
ncbi:MAG TPA: GyrI-like domain-containing protein [Acidobacteriaceae bacterium]|jgi:predicted transcriptional regulator YdeE|nr:GyrI-like domain-containing protein [Acidobacteriaceae bacterium]